MLGIRCAVWVCALYIRCVLSVHQKECRKSLGCVLYIGVHYLAENTVHPLQPNKNTGFTHLQIEHNPQLGGYCLQIPVVSALCQLNL
jgi:hypothetical protein